MLLILNLIVDRKPRDYFNEVISKRIFGDMEIEFQVDYLKEQDLDLSGFSHLLLTGSELSASKENGIDEKLYNVINHFTQNKKSILGICYGHQMLAKALHGEGTCCRAEKPEFGWKKIEITR
jgi:GMP synthase (glutamine-hydrolysing)